MWSTESEKEHDVVSFPGCTKDLPLLPTPW